MTLEEWRPVPKELVNGVEGIMASNLGRVKRNNTYYRYAKMVKGKDGFYKAFKLDNKTTYIHRLVFFAFSNKPINILKQSRVIFNKFHPEMIDEEGYYRSYLEDLLFEKTKHDSLEDMIPSEVLEKKHPVYGVYHTGKWYDVYAHHYNKSKKESVVEKYDGYQLCVIDNKEMPCIISGLRTNKYIKPIAATGGLDIMITLTKDTLHTKYLLSHVILPSVFSVDYIKKTVNHIDDDPKNNHIENLQWLSSSEIALKGRQKQINYETKPETSDTNTQQRCLENEEWRKLNDGTEVSNFGRIRRNKTKYIIGCKLRGKKYRYCTMSLDIQGYPKQSKKYYIHQLVWIGFNGHYEDKFHILHDDASPLDADGCYRNWLQDLSLGSRTQNNLEHHVQKRLNLSDLSHNVEIEQESM